MKSIETQAMEVMHKGLVDAMIALRDAAKKAGDMLDTQYEAQELPAHVNDKSKRRGRKVTDDKRRGRLSPNRLLAKTDLTPATVAKLAAKGITKVGQARRVLAGQTVPGVTSAKLTPAQKRALKRVLD